jgi:quercetin dioxygenase-like cupin family protein
VFSCFVAKPPVQAPEEDNVKRHLTHAKLLLALVLVSAPIWVLGQQSNFVGGTPSSVDATAVRTTRLKFAKGSRSNWHSHSWGQLLMIEEGKGRHQVRGGKVEETVPGKPWWTPANVEHWHGAAPDEDALQLTIYEGSVNWLEAVSDKDYLAAPQKK